MTNQPAPGRAGVAPSLERCTCCGALVDMPYDPEDLECGDVECPYWFGNKGDGAALAPWYRAVLRAAPSQS